MKLKFKQQAYQTHAVEAVADCFLGQPSPSTAPVRMSSLASNWPRSALAWVVSPGLSVRSSIDLLRRFPLLSMN